MDQDEFFGSTVVHGLEAFKGAAELMIANRRTDELEDVRTKVFTRDLFGSD